MAEGGGLDFDEELAGAGGGFGDVIDYDFLLFSGESVMLFVFGWELIHTDPIGLPSF